MESYPGELLVGVFPLVFCVDATLEKKAESGRNQFDKFLDTLSITSSMVDGGDDMHEGGPMMQRVEEEQSNQEDEILLNNYEGERGFEFPTGATQQRRSSSTRVTGDSSADSCTVTPTRNQQDGRIKNKTRSPFNVSRSPFSKGILKGSKRNSSKQRSGSGDGTGAIEEGSKDNVGIEIPPSFAEALQKGQSFFQRARIVSSSARHGFPPSKDPTGKSNRAIAISGLKPGQQPPHLPTSLQKRQHQKKAIERLKSAMQSRPIDGILPSGWLEKHAAALPSAIVVVTQIHPPHDQQVQQRQNKLLLDTLDNLQHSLASKRRVDVKIVAVIQEGVSPILADQWAQGIHGKLPSFLHNSNLKKTTTVEYETILTLVEERELRLVDEADILPPALNNPKTSPLPGLHQSIRRSSLRYYKDRSQETKNKLIRLRGPQAVTSRSWVLLPLSIRYFFKTAMFYEFQWKQDKTLKYLVEAYRLTEIYYSYLLFWKYQRDIGALGAIGDKQMHQHEESNLTDAKKEELQLPVLENSEEVGSGEGVEMFLPDVANSSDSTSFDDDYLSAETPPVVVEDMVYQCRAIADWLNFKILQMCLVCQDRNGTIAASVQWQRHTTTFCCPRRSFLNTTVAPWLDWSYVAQQRLVTSQLLERYPPRAMGELGDGGNPNDRDLLRCSSWRTYEAAAEALLKVGYHIRNGMKNEGMSSLLLSGRGANEAKPRIRYVGGIDQEGLRASFVEESKKLHKECALNCAMRGISLYEKELEKLETTKIMIPWSRSGARLHYLAGGALVGLSRYSEAVSHLEKAMKLCIGWSDLENQVRSLLIECYKHQDSDDIIGTVQNEDGSRRSRTSFLLQTYFNAKLSSNGLATALENLKGMKGVDVGDDLLLQWHCDFIDGITGESPTPPFSFSVTFPDSTHGYAGQKVKAYIFVQSNLEYTVRVNQISVMTVLGPISVPPKDFPPNVSCDSDSHDFITISPNGRIEFETELDIPSELNEENANPENAPIAKAIIPRPRTGGYTAGGGSRYSSIEKNVDTAPATVPWSNLCLGGKPICCKGLTMTFSIASSAANDTFVRLVIEVKQPQPQANTKRVTFEENNYISAAWKRPWGLSLKKGPRCLRLLSPKAKMLVTNVTGEVTNGKAVEGTVNRVVLKLKAAESESCTNVVVKITSSSTLTNSNGNVKPISVPGDGTSSEDAEDMMNPLVRTPVLVKPDPSSETFMTDFGYILPSGWTLAGKNDSFVVPVIKAGEETYACIDVYRPTIEPFDAQTEEIQAVFEERKKLNDCRCETKISISIQYHEETTNQDKANNSVSLDHSVAVVWSSPMSIAFSTNVKDVYPSGNQHPSNIVSSGKQASSDSKMATILIDDGNIFTKGILDPIASSDIQINEIQFTDTQKENTSCKYKLLSGLSDNGTIYRGQSNDRQQLLRNGSKMSFAWMTQVSMSVGDHEESVAAPIGVVSVHWQPSPMKLSKDLTFTSKDDFVGCHGPLQLAQPSICRFSGPVCHIESAPFEVIPENLPNSIKIETPIEVTYRIRNKRPIDQELEMKLQELPSNSDELQANNGILVAGPINKTVSLGPFESHSFSYTALPTTVGNVYLPSVTISSTRYNTWVIRESFDRRSIFVLP